MVDDKYLHMKREIILIILGYSESNEVVVVERKRKLKINIKNAEVPRSP